MRTQRVDLRQKDLVRAAQRLDRERRRDVHLAHQGHAVVEGENQLPEHPVGAVDERESLFLRELNRRETRVTERVDRSTSRATGVTNVPFAHQGEGHVRERREVTGAAERSELVHDRSDAGVEQCRVRFGGQGTNARDAAAEIGEARDHHRAHHFGLDLRTDARCVGADERALQVAALVGRNRRGRERTEARREPVDRISRVDERVDRRTLASQSLDHLVAESDRLELSRHRDELGSSERFQSDNNRHNILLCTPKSASSTSNATRRTVR